VGSGLAVAVFVFSGDCNGDGNFEQAGNRNVRASVGPSVVPSSLPIKEVPCLRAIMNYLSLIECSI
jgi:hypothetical protein